MEQNEQQLKTNELPSTKVSVRQDEAEAYMKEEMKRVEKALADLNTRTGEFGLPKAVQERLASLEQEVVKRVEQRSKKILEETVNE